jgi:LDH2 family malate/lactate/ureidoglycolate dehydrogenase
LEKIRVEPAALSELVAALFVAAGVGREDAETISRVQVEADLRGMHSHGTRAVPMYLRRIGLGIINPRPEVKLTEAGPLVVVDGDDGPGQVVATKAMAACIAVARRQRLGAAVVRRSNHLGAAGYYANLAAQADLIGFVTTNGNLVLAPWGGLTPTVGNNPIAVGIPAGSEPPVVVDVAMSVVAGGKIDLIAAEGQDLPAGWWLDAAGQPTRDLGAALAGLGIPLGAPVAGHKGFGLAFAMEVLAGALTGARYGREHTLEVEDGPRPWDEGHFLLALDPTIVLPLETFKARVDQMVQETRSSQVAPGGTTPHAPGALGWERRARALREGIALPGSIYRALEAAASAYGVPFGIVKQNVAPPPG